MNILLIRNIFSNLGDEAMLQCEIEVIKSLTKAKKFTVLTDNPELIRHRYKINTDYSDSILNTPFSNPSRRLIHNKLNKNFDSNKAVKFISNLTEKTILPFNLMLFVKNAFRLSQNKPLIPSPKNHLRLLSQIKEADLIIGGGGLIPSIKGIYLPKKTLYQAIQILEKPLILHGQSILPNIQPSILNIPRKIVLRDHLVSRRNIQKMGASEENLVDGLDPAFSLKTRSLLDFPDTETLNFISQPFIALNLRGWKKIDFESQFQKIADTLKKVKEKTSINRILFFGMQKSGTISDYNSFEVIKKYLSNDFLTHVFPFEYEPNWLKSVLGEAFYIFTIRYHGVIFGLTQSVPTIGFSVSPEYDLKLRGVFQMFNQEDWLYDLRNLNSDALFSQLETFAKLRSEIIEELEFRNKKLKSSSNLKMILNEFFYENNKK